MADIEQIVVLVHLHVKRKQQAAVTSQTLLFTQHLLGEFILAIAMS
jgi:hypothetical protein